MGLIPVIADNSAEVVGTTPVIVIGPVVGKPGTPIAQLQPRQVVGLVPLIPCDETECREVCDPGWKNPVFGELVGKSYQGGMTYENDWNSWLVDVSVFKGAPNAVTVTFILEKLVNKMWTQSAILNTSAFGKNFALTSIVGHASYVGYAVNWGAVVFHKGPGCYRIKSKTTFNTGKYVIGFTGGTQATCTFDESLNTCMTGALTGTLQTITGTIPATYTPQ